jgi:hypothetical protein
MRAERLKTAPMKAVHTLRAVLKDDQTGLRILSAFRTAAKSVGSLHRAAVSRRKQRDGKKTTDKRDGDHEKYSSDQLAADHRIVCSSEGTAPLWEITQTLSGH